MGKSQRAVPVPRGRRPELPGHAPARAPKASDDIARMIRVDHAGEFGALRIYQGQLAVLSRGSDTASLAAVRHMAEQEQKHFDAFDRMVKTRGVRPTALEPVWHVAGYALGAATALMGPKAAMACTVAIEDTIDAHYKAQIETLDAAEPKDAELHAAVTQFRDEELEHRAEALKHGAEDAPAYPLLSAAIRFGCRMAISLSERI